MLIATVEDVLRAIEKGRLAQTFQCNAQEMADAYIRMYRNGFISVRNAIAFSDEPLLTPRGAEFIRRAEAGWPAEEVG
jgi:hypothetical protein